MQKTRTYPFLLGAVVIAVLMVVAGAPLTFLVPFALLLACPLVMISVMSCMSATGNRTSRRVDDDHSDDGGGVTNPGERPTTPWH